jgi:hypothetical protein
VSTTEDQMVPAGHSVDPVRWHGELDALLGRIAARFGRVEPRRARLPQRPGTASAFRWPVGLCTHRPRSFLGPYQEVRSQGPVDCSTVPVAKKSWATAMA